MAKEMNMFRAMRSRVLLTGVLLVAAVSVLCLADDIINVNVNINPHKIVLNAEGKADDVQANIPIGLASALIVDFDITLSFEGTTVVVEAESARYCLIDDILIIGFDRTDLQKELAEEISTTTTVTATVDGYVTVINANNDEIRTDFIGSDTVQVVEPGKKDR
jgi:hypothetical protein